AIDRRGHAAPVPLAGGGLDVRSGDATADPAAADLLELDPEVARQPAHGGGRQHLPRLGAHAAELAQLSDDGARILPRAILLGRLFFLDGRLGAAQLLGNLLALATGLL